MRSDVVLDGEWAALGARIRAAAPAEYQEILDRLRALADAKEREADEWRRAGVSKRILLRAPASRESR